MVMQAVIQTSDASVQLSQALLLYTGQNMKPYLSVHGVQHPKVGQPVILPGVPASKAGLIAMLQSLAPEIYPKPSLMDERVLAQGPDCLVWYNKPQKRKVWFKCKQLGERSATVPLPGLVFMRNASSSAWHVFAYKGDGRPTAETPLYTSPFFNVWSGGKICVGNVDVPNGAVANNPEAWDEAFFNSYFTHPNIHQPKELTLARGGAYKLWERLLDGKCRQFPEHTLVATRKNLSQAFDSVFKGGY